ncbi:MAG: serine/threonine-protein kinase [Gemmatimonadaceae bacterium]
MEPASSHDPIRERLQPSLDERYRIEREIGAGGMATVYLAEDVKHHRKVAIKVLHAELSAVLGAERFIKEIELTANLQHPHIVPLFDSGSADGLLFYVMPFVEGETLRDRLKRDKQLPIADAVRIATEVADALEYAHSRGVVHRDIKPENILLQGGHCVVADFGIALALAQAGGQRITQTGLALGTPQYMSLEQAMDERDIGPRSDIYSLGAVTYEMLSGDPPFTGSTAQAIVAQVITTVPRSLTAQRKSIPSYVDDAVMTALEKLPADRFASAAEFATAMNGARGAPPRAGSRRTTGLSRSTRFAARYGTLPWVLSSALLAILLIASVASRFVSRAAACASSIQFSPTAWLRLRRSVKRQCHSVDQRRHIARLHRGLRWRNRIVGAHDRYRSDATVGWHSRRDLLLLVARRTQSRLLCRGSSQTYRR